MRRGDENARDSARKLGTPLPIGLGAMPLSTSGRPDEKEAIRVIHAALNAGIRLLDTADAYCTNTADTGHNERLIAEALTEWDGPVDEVVVATKGGHTRDARGAWQLNGSPAYLAQAARRSRDRLGVERIALYYLHRPDPAVRFVDSVAALGRLLDDGIVEQIGLSNVDVAQLQVATTTLPVAAVQNSFSPYDLSSLPVLHWCTEQGIPFVAWAPLGGAQRAAHVGSDVHTRPFARLASVRGASIAQVVLAWVLAHGALPIPGARRSRSIIDSAGAANLELTETEMADLKPRA
jgi:aryl-alcohol dehydrogenase-like predicted oxidoreductase